MMEDSDAKTESSAETSPDKSGGKEPKVKRIPVVEVFGPTIQGEGAMVGVRTSFIRFGLCDYRCTMCDSLHAVLPELVKQNATWMSQEEIAQALYMQHGGDGINNCEWVTFSGGNPCMHNLEELIFRIRGMDMLGMNIKIAVETQGTLIPSWLHMCDVVTVSPKGPGMGETFELPKFVEFLKQFHKHPGFNVKVVVFSAQDIEFAASINRLMLEWGCPDQMYLSLGNPYPPGKDTNMTNDELKLELLKQYEILTEDLLQLPYMQNVKFLPQLHVLCWANRQKV